MSINVTVSGNPISITRGRMVTAGPNHAQQEYERRRLLRLSQVRQQSKDIAEDVRNRVKKEQLKHVAEIEKEGEKKLKQWQSRKLLELQNQYHDALKNIGTGHKEAIRLEDEVENIHGTMQVNNKTALKRAAKAKQRLKESKNKILAEQKRDLSKQVEIRKSFKYGNKRRNSDTSSTDTNTDVSGIVTDCDNEGGINVSVDVNPDLDNNLIEELFSTSPDEVQHNGGVEHFSEEFLSDKDESLRTSLPKSPIPELVKETIPIDTRISDLIKRRSQALINPSHSDHSSRQFSSEIVHRGCNLHANRNNEERENEIVVIKKPPSTTTVQQNIYNCTCPNKQQIVDLNQLKCRDFTDDEQQREPTTALIPIKAVSKCDDLKKNLPSTSRCTGRLKGKNTDRSSNPSAKSKPASVRSVPVKPKVTLTSVKEPTITREPQTPHKIEYFDYSNRFKEPKAPEVHVERISENDLVMSADISPDVVFMQKIRQRDAEAQIRGKKAMEKERIRREYSELLEKLPALQKLERLQEISKDKPEYHMSEDRLKQHEKKKQDVLDNTYEKLFADRKLATVTIPVKNHTKETRIDVDLDESDDLSSLNLRICDEKAKTGRLFTEEEVESLLKEQLGQKGGIYRSEQLKDILQRLKRQREELVKELQNMPHGGSLGSVLNLLPHSQANDTQTNGENLNAEPVEKLEKIKVKKRKNEGQIKSTESLTEPPKKAQQVGSSDKFVKRDGKSKVKSSGVAGRKEETGSRKRRSEITSSNESIPNIEKKKNKNIQVSTSRETVISTCTVSTQFPRKRSKHTSTPVNSETALDCKPTCKCQDEVEQPKLHSELCEIVIQIKEGQRSQVILNSVKNNIDIVKSVTVSQPKLIQKSEVRDGSCNSFEKTKTPSSWHEKLSRSSISKDKNHTQSTSSTSYMSPPTFETAPTVKTPPTFETAPTFNTPPVRIPPKNKPVQASTRYKGVLTSKPQQENLPYPEEKRDQNRLLYDVQKLLNMSRGSVEELGVSSVSNVSTPSQSVIGIETNMVKETPKVSIPNLLNLEELQKRLSFTPDQPEVGGSSITSPMHEAEVDKSRNCPKILEHYAKIAESCSKRISNLSAMIEKVREEKNKMLHNSGTLFSMENDSSTGYFDLPSPGSKKSNSPQISPRAALEIDFGLAETLKSLSSEEVRQLKDDTKGEEVDFSERLQRLVKPQNKINIISYVAIPAPVSLRQVIDQAKVDSPVLSDAEPDFVPILQNISKGEKISNKSLTSESQSDFVPILQDIVKGQKLTLEENKKSRRPPPARSVFAARKLREDACIIPHELSTIPEADSQTRIDISSAKSIETVDVDSARQRLVENIEKQLKPEKNTEKTSNESGKQLKLEKKTEKASNELEKGQKSVTLKPSSSDMKSLTEFLATSATSKTPEMSDPASTSSDEKLEMMKIEAMLRSIGMEWAIPTLRKTQETLALTSSSSSSTDLKSGSSIKDFDTSTTDVKEFLEKYIFNKISSSTLKSDVTAGSVLNDSQDISSIPSGSFTGKKTSTPLPSISGKSKRGERSLTSDSDVTPSMTSVKHSKKDYYTLSDVSSI